MTARRWTATPPTTSPIPPISTAVGTCPSTRIPIAGRGRGQERDEERVGRASEPRHRELVADIRDHGRGDSDAKSCNKCDRIGQRRRRCPAEGRRDRERDEHRRGQAVDPAHLLSLSDPVTEHDVDGEQQRVGECERHAHRLALEPDVREQIDACRLPARARTRSAACASRERRARSPAGTRSPRRCRAAAGRSRGRSTRSSPRARLPTRRASAARGCRAVRTPATGAARARRLRPQRRSAATPRPAARRGRRGAPRTPAPGSGRRRCRRSTRAAVARRAPTEI